VVYLNQTNVIPAEVVNPGEDGNPNPETSSGRQITGFRIKRGMTKWMSYKKNYSQGDFGVDKTDKKSADLVLFKKDNQNNSIAGRVINLSQIQPGELFDIAKVIKKQKRERKKRTIREAKNDSKQTIQPMTLFGRFPQGKPRIIEPIEISHPDRQDILSILEEIESINYSLKNQTWRVETNFAEEPVLVIERGSRELPDVEDLVNINIEDYLWLKDRETPKKAEVDILEGLLAEPDADDFYETQNIIVVPSSHQMKGGLRRGDENQNTTFPNPFSTEDGRQVASIKKELISDQSDFLARWQQKNNTLKIASTIPFSRKSLGGRNNLRPSKFKFMDLAWRGLSRQAAGFLSAGFLIYLVIFGLSLVGQGLLAKENVLSSALSAYKSMLAAKDSASSHDFSAAGVNFDTAYRNFLLADQELNKMGRGIIYVLEKLPGGSVVGSGAALVGAGENFAKAGQSFSKIADIFLIKNLDDYFSDNGPSLTQKIAEAQGEIGQAQIALAAAASDLENVNASDLPPDVAPQIASLKEKMPQVLEAAGQLKIWSNIFLEALGHRQARKYLLIFQNNSESRPTGGFIGTYGLVDLDEGRMKNLFIDGIFNLDGQLYEKITPPKPIQKISTAWSTHDANWFADFPTSAKKIMSFYEKAGGATVDGVISLTPTVVERLLALTGQIDLPQYNVTLDQNNFLDLTQYKVEVDYDKELNQPKKILADFAPIFLAKLWQIWPEHSQEVMKIFVDSLAEKHILFYFTNSSLEQSFANQGWTGEILPTEKDYLSVINTNINGYKTDKVIEQKISHSAVVQNDGSIIDTVKITRAHNGGKSQYDWYNKVNADYLRVYVPLGSKLILAQGQTLESYSAPIDYAAQNFKIDADVARQESSMQIDQNSGTQIFEESGKTVFGNWVYVSPGETAEVTYQYLLPFKIDLNQDSSSYSLLAQKQSGSMGSDFESTLQLPSDAKITWQYPNNLDISGSQIKFSDSLRTDKFYGVVLTK